jgi:hypothetical protein
MADETLRRNLATAFDPGPDFPNRLLLSRTMAILDAEFDRSERKRAQIRIGLARVAIQLVAGVVAVVLAVVAVAAFFATHHLLSPTPARTPHFQIKAPGAAVCNSNCSVGPLLLVSANMGWLAEQLTPDTSSPACNPVCPTTSVIFRTDDGGFHWRAQLSWLGWAQEILASPDGREVLVVPEADQGAALHHSTDGGVHWTSFDLPAGVGQAMQTICKFGGCHQQSIAEQLYFLNPREGWVLSQEATFTTADLFHTTDSGAHWTLTRVDIKAAFGVDVATGLTDPNGNVDHSLPGQLVFADSATGWFLPVASWDTHVTHDGGTTWRLQSVPRPIGVQPDTTAYIDDVRLFSNHKDGVLSLRVRIPGQGGPPGVETSPYRYTYTTSDGGDHWSNPTHPPSVQILQSGLLGPGFLDVNIDFIDATHWVGWPQPPGLGPAALAGFMHTSDAGQHWNVLPANSVQVVEWFEFLDPSRGWALAGESAGVSLYETTDGGATWTSLSLPELS